MFSIVSVEMREDIELSNLSIDSFIIIKSFDFIGVELKPNRRSVGFFNSVKYSEWDTPNTKLTTNDVRDLLNPAIEELSYLRIRYNDVVVDNYLKMLECYRKYTNG